MADTHFPDEWLAHSLEGVLTPELLVELREKAPPPARLWETLVAQKIASDEQILTALSTRFRLKLADLAQLDPAAKERVPEQVARRYHILPLRATDSYLEVATANPFDLDMEKDLAFATAREVRLLLQSPAKITEQLDVLYRPEKALDKLLSEKANDAAAHWVRTAFDYPRRKVRGVDSVIGPSIEKNFVRPASRWARGVKPALTQPENWGLGDVPLEARTLCRADWDQAVV